MEKVWTPAQQAAIQTRGKNILVSAAAGAGKTAVLIERLLQLIVKEHIGIEQILMVTFTNAAAGEMRSRMYEKLQEALEAVEENERPWVRRQLHFVGMASISTIHAFCMEVVRQYAFMLQMDSGFRVGDVMEMQLLKEEVLQDVMEEAYAASSMDFLRLADLFATPRSDQRLRELILQVYEFIQNQPEPEMWLQQKVNEFIPDLSDKTRLHPLQQVQLKQVQVLLEGAENILQQAIKLAQEDSKLWEKYASVLKQEVDLAQRLQEEVSQAPQALFHLGQKISFARLPNAPKDVDKEIKERVQKLRNQGKDRLNEAGEISGKDWEQAVKDLEQMQPVIQALQELVLAFAGKYRAAKTEQGLVDFNDLEHLALQLLRLPEVSETYRQRFREIFVDEYQDSNPVQEEILRCISRKGHLFMVGDIKQSIYRFRSADPDLFRNYYETYREKGDDAEICGQVIDMQHNFRSSRMILEAVNDLFGQIMKKQTAEIDYDQYARLLYQENQAEGMPVEVLLLQTQNDPDAASLGTAHDPILEELERMNSAELEAMMIAQKIQSLMQETIEENGQIRPMCYHDIVILMRSLVSHADIMAQVLADQGIPVYTSLGKGYFDVIEITMFLDLLRLLDNRLQDLPLLSVLRSPLGGFTLEDLVRIRIQFPNVSYQQAMQEYAHVMEDELAERLQDFIRKCAEWQEEARMLPLSDFIWKILQETGYYDYVGAMPGGSQRQANLRLLLEKAEVFEQKAHQGLFRFLRYMEKVRQSGSRDHGVAGLLSENDDVVRMMSIHRSKGLEFPVVILAGMNRRINFRDTQARLLLHKTLGLGIQYADSEKRIFRNTLPRELMAQTVRMEQLAEDMRVLYVACTRARQHLIFSAGVRSLSQAINRWRLGSGIYEVAHAASWMDWVGMVLMQHPDGKPLWDWIQTRSDGSPNQVWTSHFRIQLYDRNTFALLLQQKLQKKQQQKQSLQDELRHLQQQQESLSPDIRQRLTWQYPWKAGEEIPSKMTVTQISKLQQTTAPETMQPDSVLEEPVFIRSLADVPPDARQRGTLTHQFLRYVDFQRAYSMEILQEQLQQLVKRGLFAEEEAVAIRLETILQLSESSLGQRMKKAGALYREMPFNFLLPAEEVFPEYAQNAEKGSGKIMVQGVIDLYFEESDGLVLVDYKTDYAGAFAKARPILTERYASQLNLYRRALESLTRRKVKTAGLYLLRYGKFVEIDSSHL